MVPVLSCARLVIDPAGGQINAWPDAPVTQLDSRVLASPPCPVCGRLVIVDWERATGPADGDCWLPFGWRCPAGCDPDSAVPWHVQR